MNLLSASLFLAGLALLGSASRALRSAHRRGVLAVRGPYSFVRHPQYLASIVIMLAFLIQWPTLATLLVSPVLAWSCARLARKEERRMQEEFGCCWDAYAYGRPAFVPRLSRVCAALADIRRPAGWRSDRKALTVGHGTPGTLGRTKS